MLENLQHLHREVELEEILSQIHGLGLMIQANDTSVIHKPHSTMKIPKANRDQM